MGSNFVSPPEGIEVQYLPYERLHEIQETTLVPDNQLIEKELVDQVKNVEKLIKEKEDDIVLPNDEDTVTLHENETKEEVYISFELEQALDKLNQPPSSQELFNENMEDTIIVDNLEINEKNDGYILSDNRFAVVKIKPQYNCDESGTIVVRVWVNRQGKTIKAEAGVRGTTESASCLLNEAKIAALSTTWTPYYDAPEIQIGQITYNFYRN